MELIKSGDLYWTYHVRDKMRQYRLSESRIKRVLRFPKRKEVGVAENTVAGMQPAGSKKHPYEIWVMWATRQSPSVKRKAKFNLKAKETIVISAWRYPGISPVHEPPPIPEEVWAIIREGH
jgi:hypothetical protein